MQWRGNNPSLYVVLNKNLRSEDRDSLKVWFLYLRLFLNGLVKISPSSQQLFRGVKMNLAKGFRQGDSVIWWAFSSCSDDRTVPEKFCGKTDPRTIFEIESNIGRDIRKYSNYPAEKEILLMAARYMQVVSNITQEDDLTVICLKETKPPYELIVLPTASSPSPPKGLTAVPTRSSGAVRFAGQRVDDQNMSNVVKAAIEEDQCRRLDICHCQLASGCFETLGEAITQSVTLIEVNLPNNRLSSRDIGLLASKLSLNPTRLIPRWSRHCPIWKRIW